ncbi:phosphopantetheine-binding protein [Streptomyces sp. NPDC002785]|uniref:phosphopantetheine-binding protein n=1 Tax=Streptomyces sp. NPDC002785 TaxID=3154543 RepID=UPI00332E11FF
MTAAFDTDLLEKVLRAVRQIRPEHTDPGPDTDFRDLGLDSLDRLALVVAVEQATGIPVPDRALSDAATPADLARRLPAIIERSTPMDQEFPSRSPSPELGWIDDGARAGEGTRLWHQAQIADGAVVGASCTLGKGSFVGSGSTIGDHVKIGNYAGVFGASVADEAMICPGVLLLEDPAPRATTPDGQRKGPDDWTRRPVTINTGATIGAGAVIAPGVTVGAHALVALGAVVLRDVPAYGLVIGNPARQVGWVCRCGHTLDPSLRCTTCWRAYRRDGDELAAESQAVPLE